MNLLLDTHLILWWQAADPRLPAALPPLVEAADAVYVSQVSLWEIVVKQSIGKLSLDVAAFEAGLEGQGFHWLPLRNAHLLRLAQLPTFADHRDPFDRLLVAQSLSEPLLMLTVDRKLDRYGETVRVI